MLQSKFTEWKSRSVDAPQFHQRLLRQWEKICATFEPAQTAFRPATDFAIGDGARTPVSDCCSSDTPIHESIGWFCGD